MPDDRHLAMNDDVFIICMYDWLYMPPAELVPKTSNWLTGCQSNVIYLAITILTDCLQISRICQCCGSIVLSRDAASTLYPQLAAGFLCYLEK
jgi:hypothetical protein